MSPPQADAHVTLYNKLPLISEAYAILRQELKADSPLSNDDLVLPILKDPDVRALFLHGAPGENEGGIFGIWVVHRHFVLENGERMVSIDNVTKPVPKDSTRTVAGQWDCSGNEIEFLQTGEDTVSSKAPSASFVMAFQGLMFNKFGVSALGICFTPLELDPGFIYKETTDAATRSQIVTVVPDPCSYDANDDSNHTVYSSAWSVLAANSPLSCVTGECKKCAEPKQVSSSVL